MGGVAGLDHLALSGLSVPQIQETLTPQLSGLQKATKKTCILDASKAQMFLFRTFVPQSAPDDLCHTSRRKNCSFSKDVFFFLRSLWPFPKRGAKHPRKTKKASQNIGFTRVFCPFFEEAKKTGENIQVGFFFLFFGAFGLFQKGGKNPA